MDAISRTGGALRRFKVRNFSKEGIGVISSEALKQGDNVELELTIPGDNVPVVFQGEVAWARQAESDSAQCKSGIRFTKVSNEDKSRMLEYIYHKWIVPSS
jgi:Tfp pilus assembly protein PilZ